MRKCEVQDCENKHLAKGLCTKHYLRVYKNGSLEPTTYRGISTYDRVIARSEKDDKGCLIYNGCKTPNGYGHVRDGNKMKMAHRVTFEYHNGPVPEGMELDHKCRNRPCVNHEHLEVVTHQINVQRGIAGQNYMSLKRNYLGQFCKKEKELV